MCLKETKLQIILIRLWLVWIPVLYFDMRSQFHQHRSGNISFFPPEKVKILKQYKLDVVQGLLPFCSSINYKTGQTGVAFEYRFSCWQTSFNRMSIPNLKTQSFLYVYVSVFLCMGMGVQVSVDPRRDHQSPWSWRGCELPTMGAGNQTPLCCTSSVGF